MTTDAQRGEPAHFEPGDLVPDPDHPGRLHTVSHVIEDGDQLRVGTIAGRVLIVCALCGGDDHREWSH